MQKRSLAFAASLALAAVLAACSGGGGSPSGGCTNSAIGPQLLYPIPGTTAVPDNVGVLIYSAPTSGYAINLFQGSLAAVATTPTALPATLPSPIATPANAAWTSYAVSFPTLSSLAVYKTQYSVTGTCFAQFGFFSTQ